MSEKNKSGAIDRKYVIKLALVLLLISAVSALLLALTNYITKEPIAKQSEQKEISARQEVLPEADTFKPVDHVSEIAQEVCGEDAELIKEAYVGYKNNTPVGFTVKVSPKGYGGTIEMIVGVLSDGQISAIQIISLSETAGLGAKAQEDDFRSQFNGLSAEEEVVFVKGGGAIADNNEVDAITGATITTKAVLQGTNAACRICLALMQDTL